MEVRRGGWKTSAMLPVRTSPDDARMKTFILSDPCTVAAPAADACTALTGLKQNSETQKVKKNSEGGCMACAQFMCE